MLFRFISVKTWLHVRDHVDLAVNSVAIGCSARRRAARGVAQPGIAAIGIVQLRRQDRGEALADEDDRLAPFAQAAERIAAPLSAVIDDLVADPLDRLRRIVRVLLLELVARLVVEAAALELLDRADQARRGCG